MEFTSLLACEVLDKIPRFKHNRHSINICWKNNWEQAKQESTYEILFQFGLSILIQINSSVNSVTAALCTLCSSFILGTNRCSICWVHSSKENNPGLHPEGWTTGGGVFIKQVNASTCTRFLFVIVTMRERKGFSVKGWRQIKFSLGYGRVREGLFLWHLT